MGNPEDKEGTGSFRQSLLTVFAFQAEDVLGQPVSGSTVWGPPRGMCATRSSAAAASPVPSPDGVLSAQGRATFRVIPSV